MASLLNKLTGHTSDKDATTNADHQHHSTTGHHSGTTNTAGTTGHHSTTTHTTGTTAGAATTGNAPYGTTGTTTEYTARTGAAYTGANTANTHTTGSSDVYTQRQGTNITGDYAITRSEEQLRVAKERVETGKAELNKYVTTEHVQQSVPVTRERVVIEREPINAANIDRAMAGSEIREAHYETTLSEDRVAVAKEVVPIERIRLAKQVESSVENVGADLRKEHVDFTHTALNTADKVEPHTTGYQQHTATTTKTTGAGAHTTGAHTTGAAGVPHTKY